MFPCWISRWDQDRSASPSNCILALVFLQPSYDQLDNKAVFCAIVFVLPPLDFSGTLLKWETTAVYLDYGTIHNSKLLVCLQ